MKIRSFTERIRNSNILQGKMLYLTLKGKVFQVQLLLVKGRYLLRWA